ncbi:MAG: hypothetical protein O7G31_14990 [Calditrichaeota bacterium]|nr:hypothetical protein [Calditrichota bacterium]
MKSRLLGVLTLLSLIFSFDALHAQLNFNGGPGLVYVQSAWTLERGHLTAGGQTRFFGENADYTDSRPLTVWNVSGRVNINYGMGKHFELAVTPIIYQDLNRPSGKVSSPDDLVISVKVGSFNSPGSSLTYGFTLGTRLPLGEVHNVPFEPYASDNVSWGLGGLLSYTTDPLYPEAATSVHFNLGYWNHNDVGVDLVQGGSIGTEPSTMSQELLYGIGVKVPKDALDFSVELYGNAFLQRPPEAAYSRENYLYLTPAVAYKPWKWMTFQLGLDIRLASGQDETLYAPDPNGVNRTLPNSQSNYPTWRLHFGSSFSLLPTSIYHMSERDLLMQKAQSRRELFEQIIREQDETESAEAELERIRAERIRAEKELERLRRVLEGEPDEDSGDNEN